MNHSGPMVVIAALAEQAIAQAADAVECAAALRAGSPENTGEEQARRTSLFSRLCHSAVRRFAVRTAKKQRRLRSTIFGRGIL
jgi:hypothetical protein